VTIAITAIASVVLTLIALPALMWWSRRFSVLLDQPNRVNAMHTKPIARVGGLAIIISAAIVTVVHFGFKANSALAAIGGAALLLSALSAVDDARGLPVWLRLVSHLAACAAIALLLTKIQAIDFSSIGTPLTVVALACITLALAWGTNLYNFMDGANGLAGLMATIGFGAFAIALFTSVPASQETAQTATTFAHVCASIAFASATFLAFNLRLIPNAHVFMGDAGSIPLGFLASVIGLYGMLQSWWPWWFPIIVFSPFIVDATVTLLKRLIAGKRIWHAHREHYYHRLIITLNWSHAKTAMAYCILMLLCAIFALSLHRDSTLRFLAPLWVIKYVLLLALLEWRFHRASVSDTQEQQDDKNNS
jgi:UDP-N-acetylmuramyl pentapeptide phosphotransferase/UDP-N-acetylglucosamine-1-phosphate transferase